MGLLTDITPLRESRQYRLLYLGHGFSFLGRQFTVVAAPVQVFSLTDSTLAVGLLGLAELPALIVGSVIGGALADARDRRSILILTQVVLAVATAGLAWNAMLDDPHLWVVYVLGAVIAGLSGVDSPTRTAAVPSLVTTAQLPAALALNQLVFQVGVVAGPALAGLVIAQTGLAAAYWIDVGTFGISLLALLAMAPMVPEGGGTRFGLSSVTEGWRFLRGHRAIQGTMVIDINAMVFGAPRALFPEFGTEVFGGGPTTVGLLYAAPGAGALVGAVASGWLERVDRQGRAVLWAVVLWGAAVTAFGLSPWLWFALLMLALAGWADVVSAVFRNTILQVSVPDRLRGRLSSIHIAVVTGGPRLGDVESGAVAALTTARISAWSGGLACMAGVAVVARAIPELGRWRLQDRRDGV